MPNDGAVVISTKLDSKGAENGLAKLGKIVAKSAVATAVAKMGQAIVSSYAEYEQLVGGVDTLFKDSSKKLQQYAADAYKTAGMSANQYMATVTGFSASLIQSLDGDTEKAVEYADRAITDMADNANKFGTAMESIQFAYQGFAKQNYTMLDNLKLGYGGTKGEMERLLADAEKLSGLEFDISSYADVTEAIHIIQESMGVAGTTAMEAEGTISGSIASLQAAWNNFLVGMGDSNADLSKLAGDVVRQFEVVGENVLPVIDEIVGNIPGIKVAGPALASVAAGIVALKAAEGAASAIASLNAAIKGLASSAGLIAGIGAASGVAIYGMTNAIVDSVPALAEAEKKLNDVAKANKDYIDATQALIDEQANVNDTYEEVSDRYARQSAQLEENTKKLAALESTSEKTRGQEQERLKTIKDLTKGQEELTQKLQETETQLAGFPDEAERVKEAMAALAGEYGYSGEEIEAELTRLNMSHEEWAALQEKNAASAADAIQEYAIKTGGSYAEIEAAVKQSGLTAEEWVARQEDAYKRAQEALAAYTDGATQLFDRINTKSEQSIAQATGNLDANAAAVDQYAQDLLVLEGKIDQALFAKLQEQGPEKAAATARMLAAASETELEAFNTAYSNAADAGLDAYRAVFGDADMAGVGDGVVNGTAEDMENNPAVKDAARKMVEDARDEAIAATETLDFSTIGKNMTDGIAEGIIAGTNDILKAVRDAINAAHEEAQLEDYQNSPSRWWKMFGLNETAGWAQGFEDGKANLLRTQGNLMDVVKSNALAHEFTRQANAEIPLRTSYAAGGQAAASSSGPALIIENQNVNMIPSDPYEVEQQAIRAAMAMAFN